MILLVLDLNLQNNKQREKKYTGKDMNAKEHRGKCDWHSINRASWAHYILEPPHNSVVNRTWNWNTTEGFVETGPSSPEIRLSLITDNSHMSPSCPSKDGSPVLWGREETGLRNERHTVGKDAVYWTLGNQMKNDIHQRSDLSSFNCFPQDEFLYLGAG